MGFNTSVIVMNDALHEIADDPEFGPKLAAAISKLSLPAEHRGHRAGEWGVAVSSNGFSTAAVAVETHHADYETVIAVGGNQARILSHGIRPYDRGKDDSKEVAYLRELADQMGFTLRKKPQRK